MTINFKPGFYKDVSFADYLADPAINNSGLKIFGQSAAKFKYWENNQKPSTPTQIEGAALHCAILQPELFAAHFGEKAAPRKGSKGRITWEEDNPRTTALTPRQWENVHGMTESFKNTPCTVARDLVAEGLPELSVWFDDPLTGLRCKIRIDLLKDDTIIVDLKSTQDASPAGFFWECKKWGYFYQAAFYTRGLSLAYETAGVDYKTEAFTIVAIENFPPYEVATYVVPAEIIAEKQIQLNATMAKYKNCLKTDKWPGYPNEITVLGEQDRTIYD